MSLHAKLAEVMTEAGRIPKNGTAPAAMGGYAFVQVGDAADAIRSALGSRGVSMLPSGIEIVQEAEHETSRGGTMTTLTVRTTWTLTDSATGETATIQSLGTGADSGDKAAPKAQTNAMKYALLMGFLLSTGDDPEQSDLPERGRRQPLFRTAAPSPAGQEGRAPAPTPTPVAANGDTYVSGKVSKGRAPVDMALRETPDGWAFGFVVEEEIEGKQYPRKTQVVATQDLAHVIGLMWDNPSHADVWGELVMVPWDKDGKAMPPFRRIIATRVMTPEWTLPASDAPSGVSVAPAGAQGKVESLDDLPF